MFADARIGGSEEFVNRQETETTTRPGKCSRLLNTGRILNLFRFGGLEVDFCPQCLSGAVPPKIAFAAAGHESEQLTALKCVFDTPDGNW